ESASGLFQELVSAAGIGDYKAIDFYNDSVRSAPGVDELDTVKIAEKKAQLAALVASLTKPEDKLNALLGASSQLGNIFGTLSGANVKKDLLAWKAEIEQAKSLFSNLDATMLGSLQSFSSKFDDLLNFFNTPSRTQMGAYAAGLLAPWNSLLNQTDSNSPIFESAPDQDGNPVDSVAWSPTYKDVNGKLPWEAGYDALHLNVTGYNKTLSDLDLGVLTSKKNSFETELAKWD
ncbi:hypothetical protein CH379_019960, partial [Leptospira ellisii]|nr:hypothetical protein [Leptospira ellisii]